MELEDLFYYDPSWCIIVCKQCGVVPQTNIAQHIRRHHNATRAFKVASIKLFERSFDHLPLIRDADEICKNVRPLPIAHTIRFLDVFHDRICYLLFQDDRDRYVCRGRTVTEDHLKKVHNQPLRQPERRRRGEAGGIKGLAQAESSRRLPYSTDKIWGEPPKFNTKSLRTAHTQAPQLIAWDNFIYVENGATG